MRLCDFCKSKKDVEKFQIIFEIHPTEYPQKPEPHEELVIIGEVCKYCKVRIPKLLDKFVLDLISKVKVVRVDVQDKEGKK